MLKVQRWIVGGIALSLGLGILLMAPSAAPTFAADPTAKAPTLPLPEPQEGTFDQAKVAQIDLRAVRTIDANVDFLRAIYTEGQKRGANGRAFSKVGDCMISSESFLIPLGKSDFKLEETSKGLQPLLNHFDIPVRESGENAFVAISYAAASGFNAAAVLDATWSDPAACGVEESPLACEYRVTRPAFAVIMFGTNDLRSLTPEQFDYYLRKVVVETANAGIVPVIFTFPNQPGYVEQSMFFNQIVVQVAQDYSVPLVNLWRNFEALPNGGIDPAEPTHMTTPPDGNVTSFEPVALNYGHNLHNLMTLQALELLLRLLE